MIEHQALEHVDQYARRLMADGNIPGLAVAVIDRERTLSTLTYGYEDLASKAPVTTSTVFEIGSLGKPFTSIALLQLRDEGRLDLHTPVAQYLPWFAVKTKDSRPITVHHLMNHTSGIVRGTDIAPYGLYESWALRETGTNAAPGEYFSYSNIGYKTLGFLLERLTGEAFAEVIRKRVLEPLEMRHSFPVTTMDVRKKAATGHCPFYDDRPDHPSHGLAPAIWAEYGTGDGCEASTLDDMVRYLRMILNRGQGPHGRLLAEDSFNVMTLNGVWTGGDYYGYGLATYPLDGRTYIGHGGGNAGFRSAIVADMEAGLGVVFLLNLNGETDPVVNAATHVLTVVRAGRRGEPLPSPPASASPLMVRNASEYAGTYRAGDRVLDVVAEGERLFLRHGGETITLERRAVDLFFVNHPDFELFLLEFGRSDGKVVEAFHGAAWYAGQHYAGPASFHHPPEWEAFCGHYRARNPEVSNFRVVLRKGVLTLILPWGFAQPLVPLSDGAFRIGLDALSPETLRFQAVLEGRALRVDYSGCPYYRTFTP